MDIENYEIKNSEEIDNKQLQSFYNTALKNLEEGRIEDAYSNFIKAESRLGCAYCMIIAGEADKAEMLLKDIANSSPAADWLLFLARMIMDRQPEPPSFLQLRNFFETVLNMIVKYKNYEYAEKICASLDYPASFNKEVYKYTARVFIENGFLDKGIYYLKKSINLYYKDPEVHFMLAEAYLHQGNIAEAEKEYKKADNQPGGYYPAAEKLRKLKGL